MAYNQAHLDPALVDQAIRSVLETPGDLSARLVAARKDLLNLGLRNPLLNYRPLRSRGVEVVDELPVEVFRILVKQNKAMSFLPSPEPTGEPDNDLLAQPDDDEPGKLAARHVDLHLQTAVPSVQLQTRLLQTYYTARTSLEEQGVNILFLALGMLRWYEADSSQEPHHSPLLLIPVALERSNARQRFHLSFTGEDITDNLTLAKKLETSFGLTLPTLPEEWEDLDVAAYFGAVETAVQSQPRWSVERQGVVLGFFSFGKLRMYQDLDPDAWPPDAQPGIHPILRALLQDGFREPPSLYSDEDQLDEHAETAALPSVVDADSSQALAMLDVQHGRNLVIQGPPGTGKSQTIVNLIAAAVAKGQTVLFVAEKMAALDVVKRRLDSIGLGRLCLELHSHKTNKKAVLVDLRQTMEAEKPPAQQSAAELRVLADLRTRLNAYCEAVNAPIGVSGITPHQAFGAVLQLQKELPSDWRLPALPAQLDTWTAADFAQRRNLVQELQSRLPAVGVPRHNPFWGVQGTVFLPADRARLREALTVAEQTFRRLRAAGTQLGAALNTAAPTTWQATEVLGQIGHAMLYAPDLTGIQVRRSEWLTQADQLADLLQAAARLAELRAQYGAQLQPETWQDDRLRAAMPAGARAVQALQQAGEQLAQVTGLPVPPTHAATEALVELSQRALTAPDLAGVQVAGDEWHGRRADLATLIQAGSRLSALHQQYADVLTPQAWDADLLAIRPILESQGRQWTRLFSAPYRRARRTLARVCQGSLPPQLDQQLALIDAIQEAQAERAVIQQHAALGAALYGGQWQGEESNWPQLAGVAEWLAALHTDVLDGVLPQALIDFLARHPDRQALQTALAGTLAALTLHGDAERRLEKVWPQAPLATLAEQLAVTNAVHAIDDAQKVLRLHGSLGAELFGTRWQTDQADWAALTRVAKWLRHLHENVTQGLKPRAILDHVADRPGNRAPQAAVVAVEEALIPFAEQLQVALTLATLDLETCFGAGARLEDLPFDWAELAFRNWQQRLDDLPALGAFNLQARSCRAAGLEVVVTIAESDPAAAQFLTPAFERAWYERLLTVAFNQRPILAQFDGSAQEQAIRNFRQLDSRTLHQNRGQLAATHWSSSPARMEALTAARWGLSVAQLGAYDAWFEAGGFTELKFLKREFDKKTRHRPIRQLLSRAGRTIQTIKPVFMMSPLSVATFVAPGVLNFDLVIFDEASQIKPVDAIGAILRGRQVVVVGDSRQLPPTSFFDAVLGNDIDAEEEATSDVESILGLFVAQNAPERMLRWHYRSRHESLIAVSNYEFYGDRLIVFPSPDDSKEELGLILHHLPHTSYDRGHTRTNRQEALEVAQAVMDHARTCPQLTLGVAAFSQAQMQAISDQLELLRRRDPTCEPFFAAHPHEPFFVKNLENVQGDERDVVFISIGYGRTPEGTIAMDFGPLNRPGGERRLNVLISRARRRCEVFTNLTARDIDLERSSARGVQALKTFLAYAETGRLDVPRPTGRGPDSPFEEAVLTALTDLGYQVRTQIGTAGFFIDLAVVDPAHPGQYLLGIECDGATYHSARSARDRDRLRQQVLEGLGWQIHRIWSTDWFHHPARELNRVRAAIDVATAAAAARPVVTRPARLPAEPAAIPMPAPSRPASTRKLTTTAGHAVSSGRSSAPPPSSALLQGGGSPATVPAYATAQLRINTGGKALHEVALPTLAGWIAQVVRVESPVHISEIARRITEAAGLPDIDSYVEDAIRLGCAYAVQNREVFQRGDFLWINPNQPPPVRGRSSLPEAARRITLIAPEEIDQAIEYVVAAAGGLEQALIPPATSRLLGFGTMTNPMREHIEYRVMALVRAKRLVAQGPSLVVNTER